jgi:hypothetical protein
VICIALSGGEIVMEEAIGAPGTFRVVDFSPCLIDAPPWNNGSGHRFFFGSLGTR